MRVVIGSLDLRHGTIRKRLLSHRGGGGRRSAAAAETRVSIGNWRGGSVLPPDAIGSFFRPIGDGPNPDNSRRVNACFPPCQIRMIRWPSGRLGREIHHPPRRALPRSTGDGVANAAMQR